MRIALRIAVLVMMLPSLIIGVSAKEYLSTSGTRLVAKKNDPIVLRGMGLAAPDGKISKFCRNDRGEDVMRMAKMGANAVRVDIDASRLLSGAGDTAYLAFIDTVVYRAGLEGLRAVLSMKCPASSSDAGNARWWDKPDNQERLILCWTMIAKRYLGRPEIAGYHLMRMPAPPSMHDYLFFMAYLIENIRTVDDRRVLIVEEPRIEGLPETIRPDELIFRGKNIVYGFSEYGPEEFTHQGIGGRPAGQPWPGTVIRGVKKIEGVQRRGTRGDHPSRVLKIDAIAPDWADRVSPGIYIDGHGSACFSDVKLFEITKDAGERLIFADTFADTGPAAPPWWAHPPEAPLPREEWDTGLPGLVLEKVETILTAQPFSEYDVRRLPPAVPGRRYRLTARVAVQDVDDAGLEVLFVSVQQEHFGEPAIRNRIAAFSEWSRLARVPVMMMEFAAPRSAPQEDEILWMRTVRDECEKYGISWFHRSFREYSVNAKGKPRRTFAMYCGRSDRSTDSAVLWPQLKDLLFETFRENPAPMRTFTPLVHRDNPVPPPARGCWLGANAPENPSQAHSRTTFAGIMQFGRKVGKLPAWIHVFLPWRDDVGVWSEFPEDDMAEMAAAGVTPMITWESLWGDRPVPDDFILQGHADTYVRSWADASKAMGRPYILRLSGSLSGAAFRRVRDVFDAVHAVNVAWMWSPAVDRDAGAIGLDLPRYLDRDMWPGEEYVDWVGIVLYDRAFPKGAGDKDFFPAKELENMMRSLARYERPVCIAEMSCEAGKDQGGWWQAALRSLRTRLLSGIGAMVIVESIPFERTSSGDFHLRNDASYFMGKELVQPYFVGGE